MARIGLVFGGRSVEHLVSVRSARTVMEGLVGVVALIAAASLLTQAYLFRDIGNSESNREAAALERYREDARVEAAEFLTPEQQRGIYYDNAARFLRLDAATIERDYRR